MPQIIEVPGHGQVEFPDGMSDEQIVEAIRRNAAPLGARPPNNQATSYGNPNFLTRGPIAPAAAFASGVSDALIPQHAQPQEGMERRLQLSEELQGQFPNTRLAGLATGAVAPFAMMGGAIPKTVAMNAALGGEMGAFQSRGDPLQTAVGAAAGGGAPALGRLATGPLRPSASAQALLDKNVPLTLGQAVDSKGLIGRTLAGLENKATSIPVLGDYIAKNQAAAAAKVRELAINRASPPGAKITSTGREAIDDLHGAFDSAYDKLYRDGKQFTYGIADARKIYGAAQDVNLMVDDAPRKQAVDWLVANLPKKPGPISGDVLKRLESQAGRRAFESVRKGDLGAADMYDGIKEAVVGMRNRALSAEERSTAARVDNAYANFKRVQRAAASSVDGEFSPAQLNAAVRQMSGGKDRSQFARGTARMQNLSEPAAAVMRSVPNSGTVDRAAALGVMGGAGYIQPQLLAIPSAVAAGSNPMVARGLLGQYPAQQALSPYIGLLGPLGAAETDPLLQQGR